MLSNTLLLGWLLALISAGLFALLALFDPKRLRNHPAHKRGQGRQPLSANRRRALALLAFAPGVALLAFQLWAPFTVWLGVALVLGWLVVNLLAPRSGQAQG